MKKTDYIEERIGIDGVCYRVKIPYIDENGERKTVSKSFNTKKFGTKQIAFKHARDYRDTILKRIENSMNVKEIRYSLSDIYHGFLDLKSITVSTKRKYDSIYYNYIVPLIDESREFKTITYPEIQKTVNNIATEVGDDTIKRLCQLWSKLYKFAINNDVMVKDESMKIERPRSQKKIVKRNERISPEEVEELISMLYSRERDERNRILYTNAIIILHYTGMRPSEVFGLNVENIDLVNRKIIVNQRVGSNSEEENVIARTKTDSSIREIPIHEELVEPFKQLINLAIDGYLFINSKGRFINGNQFSDVVNKASGGKYHVYAMRHEFSTVLNVNGTDLRTIEELLGHKPSSMTIYYARSNDTLKRNAINSIPRIEYMSILGEQKTTKISDYIS